MSEKTTKMSLGKTSLWVLAYLVGVFVSYVVISLTLPMGPTKLESSGGLENMSLGMIFLMTVIMAPLIEEAIFRGAIYNVVRWIGTKTMGAFTASPHVVAVAAYAAIFLSALPFALVHEEAFFGVFMLRMAFGLAAGHLYYKTGRFAAPVALHMLNNSVPFALLALFASH